MRFVAAEDCRSFFRRIGFDENGPVAGSRSAARLKKTFDCCYKSGAALTPLLPRLTGALATYQGEFSECLLWAADLVWGDRSQESTPPAHWLAYRRWRSAHGETRSLYEVPGYLFDASERPLLAQTIGWALRLGWDTFIATPAGASVTALSHDDRITVYARTRSVALIADFARLALDFRHRDRAANERPRKRTVRDEYDRARHGGGHSDQ
jgi:hypothetical protein